VSYTSRPPSSDRMKPNRGSVLKNSKISSFNHRECEMVWRSTSTMFSGCARSVGAVGDQIGKAQTLWNLVPFRLVGVASVGDVTSGQCDRYSR
jgi:hypothetical protein